MIKITGTGKSLFEIRDFSATTTYVSDLAADLLHAFIDYHMRGLGISAAREEGIFFTFVIAHPSIYIMSQEEPGTIPKCYDLSNLDVKAAEKELLEDIKSDFDNWVKYNQLFTTKEEFEKRRIYLSALMNKLESFHKIVPFKQRR